MNDSKTQYELLRKYTTSSSVIDELCAYTENKFVEPTALSNNLFELNEDGLVHVWKDYLKQSKDIGVFETLKQKLVQLKFPIRKNISQSTEYRAATLKGALTDDMNAAQGLKLREPSALDLFLYENFVGKVPVVTTSNKEDFVSLIQALTYRNEPVRIPESMGAAMINGLNNWDRIRRLKEGWLRTNPLGNWGKEFISTIFPNKNLYQDRLIVLSKKPYSGVAAKTIGLSEEEWLEISLKIRLEHECAHLFTLKTFGRMANNMHDELIADYMGITKIFGKFKDAPDLI